jgi:exodeoxyribonuclease VII large subunit
LSVIKDKLSVKTLEITNIGKERIIRAGLSPANQKSRLYSAVKSYSGNKESVLKSMIRNLTFYTSNVIERNNIRVAGLENTVNFITPENVLKRGYTITCLNGRILRKSYQATKDDLIDTLFSDGKVSSRVVDKNGGKGE